MMSDIELMLIVGVFSILFLGYGGKVYNGI